MHPSSTYIIGKTEEGRKEETEDAMHAVINGLTQTQTLAALGVTFTQLLLLMRNGQFPTPLTDDGYRDVTFDATAISNFAGLMQAAQQNGWT